VNNDNIAGVSNYCSEMNRIENEWQRLKEDELAGRMFADEYEASNRCH
jgi:hypothetical protein